MSDFVRHAISAARGGYKGILPSDTCPCGGVIEVTHTQAERGGWVLRRMACNTCKKKYGKWAAADTESSLLPGSKETA